MRLSFKKLFTFGFASALFTGHALSAWFEIPLYNGNMAMPITEKYGGAPTGWTVTKGKFGVLNGEQHGYSLGSNGFTGTQLMFSTNNKVVGSQVEQTIPNFRLSPNTDYMFSIGVGERHFQKRFAGFTIQVRTANNTLITEREFGYDEVKDKFHIRGNGHEVAEVQVPFTPRRMDSSQSVKVVIIGGGGAKGGANGRESLDINYVRFYASKPLKPLKPRTLPQIFEFRGFGVGITTAPE